MRATYSRSGLLAFALASVVAGGGCAPDSSTVATDGGGADGGAGGSAATVTYTKDVQPILMAKCAPCHTGQSLGDHNIATTYADALKQVKSVDSLGCWNDTDPTMFTKPKMVGECALILIMNGRMPNGAGCGNAMPLEPDMCLSAQQKSVIAAWVAAGLPQ
jgi:hypothetical protein